MFEDMLGR